MGFLEDIRNTAGNVINAGTSTIQSGVNQLTTATQPAVTTLTGGATGFVNTAQQAIQNAPSQTAASYNSFSTQVGNAGQNAFTTATKAQDYVSQTYIKPYAPSFQETGYMVNRGLDAVPGYSSWVKERTGLSPSENFIAATSDKGLTVTQQNRLGQTVKTTYGYNDNRATSLPMSAVKGFAEGGWNEPIKQPFVFAASLATAGVLGKATAAGKAAIAGAKAYEGSSVGAKAIQTFGKAASSSPASTAFNLGQVGMLGTYIADTGARITGYGNPTADTSAYGMAKRAGGILTTEVAPGFASTAITKQNVFKGLDWMEEGLTRVGFTGDMPGMSLSSTKQGNIILNPTTGVIYGPVEKKINGIEVGTAILSESELAIRNKVKYGMFDTEHSWNVNTIDDSIMGHNIGEVDHVKVPNADLLKDNPDAFGSVINYHNHLSKNFQSIPDWHSTIVTNAKESNIITPKGDIISAEGVSYLKGVPTSFRSVFSSNVLNAYGEFGTPGQQNMLANGNPITRSSDLDVTKNLANALNTNFRLTGNIDANSGIGTYAIINKKNPSIINNIDDRINNIIGWKSSDFIKKYDVKSLMPTEETMNTFKTYYNLRKQPINKSQKKYTVKKPKQPTFTIKSYQISNQQKPSKFKQPKLLSTPKPTSKPKSQSIKPIVMGNIRGFGVQKPIKRIAPMKRPKTTNSPKQPKPSKQKSKGMLKYFF